MLASADVLVALALCVPSAHVHTVTLHSLSLAGFGFAGVIANQIQRGQETEPLISPDRRVGSASITSQENYGAAPPMPQSDSGLTEAQRKRIEDIGREIGNQMLPINSASRASMTPRRGASPETGSVNSSRPTTPQPEASHKEPSPKKDKENHESQIETAEELIEAGAPTGDEVVHKTLFHGAAPGKKANGKKKGKGKKGKGKKK